MVSKEKTEEKTHRGVPYTVYTAQSDRYKAPGGGTGWMARVVCRAPGCKWPDTSTERALASRTAASDDVEKKVKKHINEAHRA